MFRKLNALLWLRLQVLISNSTLLATLLMPFGIAVLYNEFFNKNGELSMFSPLYEFDHGLEYGKWLYGIDYDGRR